jgi:probable HAF family extracellular repeat protein
MSHCKAFGFAIFAALCLLCETAGWARAQCNFSNGNGTTCATEWSGGSVIDQGGLPGSMTSLATGINGAGQVVGSSTVGGVGHAVEWSGGSVIDLGGLPGSADSSGFGINETPDR